MQELDEQVVEEVKADETNPQSDDGNKPEQEPKAEKPPRDTFQKRVDELTRKRGEAEREAAYWKEVASKKEDPPAEKPKRADYATDEDFIDKLTDWKADQATAKALERLRSESAERAKKDAVVTSQQTFQQRAAAVREVLTDYDEVLDSAEAPLTDAMRDTILDSDVGPHLAYHLAKNPDEAVRIAGLSPLAQARELGRIEATLSTNAKPKPVSKAPEPITPTRGAGGQFLKDTGRMSDAEWEASRRKR